MIQARTQTPEFWVSEFSLNDNDIEQIYNHFLDVEVPQSAEQIARVIIANRVQEEVSTIKRLLSGRTVYRPKEQYAVGDELVFPALQFAHGTVDSVRRGYNPQFGQFDVIGVTIDGQELEFAAELEGDHALNLESKESLLELLEADVDVLQSQYGSFVEEKLLALLQEKGEFIRLGNLWFVKSLMVDVSMGHLHLAEAILEMNEGGPLLTDQILPHLDMDPSADGLVQRFSLERALFDDDRFDEVAPVGEVSWFLRRLEPECVVEVPGRLKYTSIPYDQALLSPQLLLLERELDDEWSSLQPSQIPQPVVFSLTFPHRWAGTLPLSSRILPLIPQSTTPRQRAVFVDEDTQEEIVAWVVREHRYICGFSDWYEKNGIPIGGFVHLRPGDEPGTLMLGYDRRRAQREWVRLATVHDNHIRFELMRRSVACGYDDLLIVGTDVVAAIDALWRRFEAQQRSTASLLAEIFPELANLTPQNTVHAKTLYSAVNMLRRMPPGPVFAELVRHPAFQPVGDHYWRFDRKRWQESS